MVAIVEKHVEWAVVNRMKAMLDRPPRGAFNVTESFALFTTILLWSKNRAWVDGDRPELKPGATPDDHAARRARESLRSANICNYDWRLSRRRPEALRARDSAVVDFGRGEVNADFADMSAEPFFKWLRDALAHGDGRTIAPISIPPRESNRPLLAGFKIVHKQHGETKDVFTLELYEADMRRMGARLAHLFCNSMSGNDRYFEEDAATVRIREAASAA